MKFLPQVQVSNNVKYVNSRKNTVQFVMHTYEDKQETTSEFGKKEIASCFDKQLLEFISDCCTTLNRTGNA